MLICYVISCVVSALTIQVRNKELDNVSLIRETVDDCKVYTVGACPNWAVGQAYPTSDNVSIRIFLYDNMWLNIRESEYHYESITSQFE